MPDAAAAAPAQGQSLEELLLAQSWLPSAEEAEEFNKTQENLAANYRASFEDHKKVKRSIQAGDFVSYLASAEGKTSPFKVLSALRSNEVLPDKVVRALHEQLVALMLPCLSPKSDDAPQIPKSECYRMFFTGMKVSCKNMMPGPAAAGDTAETLYKKTLQNAVALEFRVYLRTLSLQWAVFDKRISEIEKAGPKKTGRNQEEEEVQPKKFPKVRICKLWMQNKCPTKEGECKDGDHSGSLSSLAYLNTHFKLKLSDQDLIRLSSQ